MHPLTERFDFYLFVFGAAEAACPGGACSYWAKQEGGEAGYSQRFSALGGWLETPCVTAHKKDTGQIARFRCPTTLPPGELGISPAKELLTHILAVLLADISHPLYRHICPKRRSRAWSRSTGATEPFPTHGASPDGQYHTCLLLLNPKASGWTSD